VSDGLNVRASSTPTFLNDPCALVTFDSTNGFGDDADLRDVYETERQLLHVACTRARDFLLVTSVEPASEFLDDMRAEITATR
jgi:hypothetical protein